LSAASAIERAQVLSAQGAAIIDLGAESSLAHAARLTDVEQNEKLLSVVKALRAEKILVSVETYQPGVVRACLEAGANVINLTGNLQDDEIFRMIAAHDAAVILCYVQGANVREVADFNFSADPVAMMNDYFKHASDAALKGGVEKIIIDPGLGFY